MQRGPLHEFELRDLHSRVERGRLESSVRQLDRALGWDHILRPRELRGRTADDELYDAMMISLLFAALLTASAWGQVTLTPSAPATARAGATITATVALSGSSSAGPGAMQWAWVVPAGWQMSSPGGAQRTLTCAIPVNPLCVVYGLTRAPHPNGQVANVQVAIPPIAAPGTYTIGLSAPVAATVDLAPVAMPISVGAAATIRVLHRSDLNGDGSLTVEDALAMANQAVGNAACTDDQNGDGRCDAVDIQIVATAIVGN